MSHVRMLVCFDIKHSRLRDEEHKRIIAVSGLQLREGQWHQTSYTSVNQYQLSLKKTVCHSREMRKRGIVIVTHTY